LLWVVERLAERAQGLKRVEAAVGRARLAERFGWCRCGLREAKRGEIWESET